MLAALLDTTHRESDFLSHIPEIVQELIQEVAHDILETSAALEQINTDMADLTTQIHNLQMPEEIIQTYHVTDD